MENIQRNLEKEVARLRLPKLSKKDRHWTFLLVGDHGEILSVRWFKGLAIALALVLVVAVVVLFRMGFIYKSATEENKNLKQDEIKCQGYNGTHLGLKPDADIG